MPPLLRLLLFPTLIFAACPLDPGRSGYPHTAFCPNTFGISSVAFTADPDVRTYDGIEYMSFTSANFVSGPTPHIFLASRTPIGPWCNVTQVTFDDLNPF